MTLRCFHLGKLEKLERHLCDCDSELVINETRIRTWGSGARAPTPAEIKHPCDSVTAQPGPWDFGTIIGVTSA